MLNHSQSMMIALHNIYNILQWKMEGGARLSSQFWCTFNRICQLSHLDIFKYRFRFIVLRFLCYSMYLFRDNLTVGAIIASVPSMVAPAAKVASFMLVKGWTYILLCWFVFCLLCCCLIRIFYSLLCRMYNNGFGDVRVFEMLSKHVAFIGPAQQVWRPKTIFK